MLEALFLTLLTTLPPAPEELDEDLRTCREIHSRHDRLACYDQIAFSLEEPEAEPADSPEPAGSQEPAGTQEPAASQPALQDDAAEVASPPEDPILSRDPEPVDVRTPRSVTLPAVESSGRREGLISLKIHCQDRQTTISIDWGVYLGSDSPPVTTKIDALPRSTEKWSRSTDKQESIYTPLGPKKVREQRVIDFARQLLTASKLVARVIPHGTSPVTAVFDLSDIKQELKPLRRACRW